jgi:predicted NAD/FAD-binding protein
MMKSLAIIGSGISGLGVAYFLRERFDLTLFEQNGYAGGHTNTVLVNEGGRRLPVDTGFMVYNEVTYPNLTRLFKELDVATKPTDMSFSVQQRSLGLEYNGCSLNQIFGQRRNLLSPRFWRMLLSIGRFNQEAVAALSDPACAGLTLAQFVKERGYSREFMELYLVPMSSAVWSTPPELMEEFPATTLIRFWHNHGFLGMHTHHPWRTVVDGARSYVARIAGPLGNRVQLQRRVIRVSRNEVAGRVRVYCDDGWKQDYDKVVFACHGDQALRLLADPTEDESRLLGQFRYQPNSVLLHLDASVMPRTRRCWASWNYRIDTASDGRTLPTTHYWMNRLQGVSEEREYFVSLNAPHLVAEDKILKRIEYEHPLFDLGAVKAQAELPGLNLVSPDQSTYYCGAWFKYGFHEDGFTSALECARAVTGENLWEGAEGWRNHP